MNPGSRRTVAGRAAAVAIFALLALGACARFPYGNPAAEVTVVGELSAPIRLDPVIDGWAVVPVTINGQPGFRFLLDSGAAAPLLFLHARTRRLGVPIDDSLEIGGVGDGPAPRGGIARNVSLGIGSVQFDRLALTVLPASSLPALGDEEDFALDGIIGLDLFQRFAVAVDAQRGDVRLYRTGTAPIPVGASVLPLELRGYQPYVALQLTARAGDAARRVELHLDTGSNEDIDLRIGSAALPDVPARSWTRTGAGLQGQTRTFAVPLHRVILGTATLEQPVASVTERPDGVQGRDGRVGGGLLMRFAHVIDYPRRQVTIWPNGGDYGPDPRGFIGLGLALSRSSTARIEWVSAGSPAAGAGLKVGERVARVGGRSLADLSTLERWRVLRRLEPGARVEVCGASPADDCRVLEAADIRAGPPVQPVSQVAAPR